MKLYIELVLNRALTIKSVVMKAVSQACELLVHEGRIVDHRVVAGVLSFSDIESRLEHHRWLWGRMGSYRDAALSVNDALTITVILPEEFYISASLAVCKALVACPIFGVQFSTTQAANFWTEELAFTGT